MFFLCTHVSSFCPPSIRSPNYAERRDRSMVKLDPAVRAPPSCQIKSPPRFPSRRRRNPFRFPDPRVSPRGAAITTCHLLASRVPYPGSPSGKRSSSWLHTRAKTYKFIHHVPPPGDSTTTTVPDTLAQLDESGQHSSSSSQTWTFRKRWWRQSVRPNMESCNLRVARHSKTVTNIINSVPPGVVYTS